MGKIFYTGGELRDSEFRESPYLIKGLVWEQDNIIVLGDAKAGKSLFVMQMLCSLTSKHPLFDEYEVARKCRVLYVQAEGKMYESGDRYKRMTKEVSSDDENLRWLYLPHVPMDRETSAADFTKIICKHDPDFKPDVIVFDPLYMMASKGSLKDDDIAGAIAANLNKIKTHYNSVIILIHHEHRPRRNKETGDVMHEGDGSIFGSFIWRAWPDHIIHWEKKDKNTRELSCRTQRSGSVLEYAKFFFVQPDPLYFEISEDTTACEHTIHKLLEKNPILGVKEIKELSPMEFSDSSIYRALKKLERTNIIQKHERGLYRLKENKNAKG